MKKTVYYFAELFKVIIATVVCSLMAVLIMALAYMVPINRTNLDAVINLGNQEGWYVDALEHIPSLEKYFAQYQPGTMTVADDVRGFLIADDHEGFNALENAMYCNDYPRYWHGYAFVMRLLLLLFDYKEMRFLNLIIQAFLAICIFVILREKGEKRISWLALIWYVLMMPISVACCLVYGCTVDAIFLSTIFVMLLGRKIWISDTLFNITFCVIGCIVCFFDLLIFSPMGWAMPFTMMVVLYGKEDKMWIGFEKTVRSAVSWVVGYGLFWLLKMLYATLILSGKYEKNILAGAMAEATWSSGKNNVEPLNLLEKLALRWEAVHTNYIHYTYSIYALLIFLITTVAVIWFVLCGVKKDNRMTPLFIVTASPVIWIFLINTATGAHHIFDYRLLSTEICGSFLMVFLSFNRDNITSNHLTVLKRIGGVVAVGLVGLLFATQITEDIDTTNANRLGTEWVSFPKSGEISMTFTPEYTNIIGIGVSIKPESINGEYSVSIKKDGAVSNEWLLPMVDCMESNWQVGDLDWKVSAHHEYTMEIKAISSDGYGSILVYPNGLDGQVREFGNLHDDEGDINAQLVGTVRYRKRVSFTNIVIYSSLIMTFLGALILTLYSFEPVIQKESGK